MRNFNIIHRVEKGESLVSVSQKYGIPASLIAHQNGLTEDVYEGQRLVIGTSAGTLYRVKPADTLEGIAAKFGVPGIKILSDNKIDMIFPFMDIVINK